MHDAVIPEGATKWDRSVMHVNVREDVILRNVRTNIRRQLPQVQPHAANMQHIAIVGGGWSLDSTLDDLRALWFDGVKVVALNGSANWLLKHGIKPSMHVIMDAMAENAAFIGEPIPSCRYMIASQCDPGVFDAAAGRDVTIFHVISTTDDLEKPILDAFYAKKWHQVPSAGTVGMVSILLCRMLGFQYMHLFGVDSCYEPETHRHHAYPQPWNDDEGSAVFWCAGREFRCSAWQASQAGNFVDIVKKHGDKFTLHIHGDNVLAHMMETGASLTRKET